jgi:hypothetical protein
MRIEFERTGGFAGMKLRATIQAEALPPEQAQELASLIAAADFFNLPSMITAPRPGADQFVYRVTVEDAGRRHTVQTSDIAAPETLRPLLQWLVTLARTAR